VGIVKRSGQFYYWVKRIPKRYIGLVLSADGKPVQQVRQSLNTESKTEALAKAAQVEMERLAEWEALLAGDHGSAREHYEAARKLAAAHGFTYRPVTDLASGPLSGILVRGAALEALGSPASTEVARAVAGAVPVSLPDFNDAFQEYLKFTRDRHLQKSESQKIKWRQPREAAIKNFQTVVYGRRRCPPMDGITRADALKFREWWSDRVERGRSANSANKQFNQLREIFSTWSNLSAPGLENPFSRLSLKKADLKHTPPFSQQWIKDKILAPGALDKLNTEAADVLLVLINTGLRPSEVTDAPLDDYRVFENIPFLRVAPHGRELKVSHSRRDVPLVGVSLEAARRIVARGGILRYQNKANSWSALVNKFMANNDMKETPSHTAYSMRHYVEDALLAAEL